MVKEILHIGVPTTQSKPGEMYMEATKLYRTEATDSPFMIEYVRFMDGSIFPEEMHRAPHIAVKVDSIKEASVGCRVIVEPIELEKIIISFVVKDGVIFELTQFK